MALPVLVPLPGAVVNLAVLMGLCWWSAGFGRVRKGTEIIAAGNLNHQIETAHLPADLRGHAEVLNNISDGLAASVNEQMKSERFKAELITNVSHDLKTPLTSIINYVNLLKATDQTDPRAQSYIEVLDRKSLRLKKADGGPGGGQQGVHRGAGGEPGKDRDGSAAGPGAGEYEEKLEEKHLTVVRTVPEGRAMSMPTDGTCGGSSTTCCPTVPNMPWKAPGSISSWSGARGA